MLRGIRPANGLRFGLCTLAAVIGLAAVTTDPADARSRRGKRPHHARVVAYTPPYADIVIDANSGHLLHGTNADALRHPASLTKIMTLYLLFEQMEAGKFRLELAARGFGARLPAGTVEAWAAAGADHLGRRSDPRAGHQVRERRGGGRRGSGRRR